MNKQKPMKASRRAFIKKAAVGAGLFYIVPSQVLGRGAIPPSDKITIGCIGLGRQSNGLSSRFIEEDQAQIVAACDVWKSKMEWFRSHVKTKYTELKGANAYDAIDLYPRYEDLLNRDDIDAVIIATPDHWHAKIAIDAMEAGKDVYCEKPLSHTVEEGRKMVKTAKKTGRVFQTGSMQRSWENFRKACELVRNGYVGEISKVLVSVGGPPIAYNLEDEGTPEGIDWDRWCGPAPMLAYNHFIAPPSNDIDFWPKWRDFKETGGGLVTDWGAHMFDIAQWALGMDRSGPIELIPPEDSNAGIGMRLMYDNGIEMVHENFDRGNAVRFIGSEGTLDISRQFLDSKPESIVTAKIKEGDTRLYHSDNHYKDWLDAIINRSEPICDVETGHRSCTVCNITNIAYQLNRPLKWDPEKEEFDDKAANKLLKKKYRKPYVV